MPGEARGAARRDAGAQPGAHAVRRHHHLRTRERRVVRAGDRLSEPHPHPRRQRRIDEDGEEVGAVEVPVRPPVARLRRRPERQPRHQAAVAMLAELDRLRHHRAGGEPVGDAERREHRDAVRPDLQPGAHLAEFRRPLQERHRCAPARQRQRNRHAADAAAHHRDRPALD